MWIAAKSRINIFFIFLKKKWQISSVVCGNFSSSDFHTPSLPTCPIYPATNLTSSQTVLIFNRFAKGRFRQTLTMYCGQQIFAMELQIWNQIYIFSNMYCWIHFIYSCKNIESNIHLCSCSGEGISDAEVVQVKLDIFITNSRWRTH